MKKLFIILLLACSCAGTFAQGQTPPNAAPALNPAATPASTTVASANMQQTMTPVAVVKATPPADCFEVGKGSKRRIIGWVMIVGIIGLFLLVVYKTDLLRDPITNPTAFMLTANAMPQYAGVTDITKIPKPFSLSRSQLGCWTVIISCSYIYLEVCKYFSMNPDMTFNSTVLSLLGISAITAAASNVIDNSSSTDQQGTQVPSEGFLKDILSDQNGINIHRFQNVIWTLIAVVLYIGKVPNVPCGKLPDLDPTLIALTGISSLTYLGLKINENTPPAISPPAQPVAPPQTGNNNAG